MGPLFLFISILYSLIARPPLNGTVQDTVMNVELFVVVTVGGASGGFAQRMLTTPPQGPQPYLFKARTLTL